jgi:hypothetical protein
MPTRNLGRATADAFAEDVKGSRILLVRRAIEPVNLSSGTG